MSGLHKEWVALNVLKPFCGECNENALLLNNRGFEYKWEKCLNEGVIVPRTFSGAEA